MKITVLAMAGLVARTLMTASPAHANVGRPQQPSFTLSPQSDAEEVRREIADLDASSDSLAQPTNQRSTLSRISSPSWISNPQHAADQLAGGA